jgi:hypothetical protein
VLAPSTLPNHFNHQTINSPTKRRARVAESSLIRESFAESDAVLLEHFRGFSVWREACIKGFGALRQRIEEVDVA